MLKWSLFWRRKWKPTPVFLPGESQGAWWAAVYGVAQSRTRLKRLGGGSGGVCYRNARLVKHSIINLQH